MRPRKIWAALLSSLSGFPDHKGQPDSQSSQNGAENTLTKYYEMEEMKFCNRTNLRNCLLVQLQFKFLFQPNYEKNLL